MALTATSTPDEIIAEYQSTSGYDLDGSTSNCKLFIRACRLLLGLRPEQTNVDGTGTRFNHSHVERQMMQAERWLAANGGRDGNRVASRRWDMRGLRS